MAEASEDRIVRDLLDALKKEGIPFLSMINSPESFVSQAPKVIGSANDPYLQEAIAYSLILADKRREADQALDFLSALLAGKDQERGWIREMKQRAEMLRRQLAGDHEVSKRLLREWEQQTVKNLRLENFVDPAA